MFAIPYEEPLFRPPAEANSLIFQITIGCSWNRCAFCDMYTNKQFRIKDMKEISDEIARAAAYFPETQKIFLADGNAMVLSSEKLLTILNELKKSFQSLRRVSAYALPSDIARKNDEELKTLREEGLKLLYIGIETGDDDLLERINKSETRQSTIDGSRKAKNAGMKLSVMILNGLGGKIYSKQHTEKSAGIINEIQPRYLSTLVLGFPRGLEHFQNKFKGEYIPMDQRELLEELATFIGHLDLDKTIFRSDHVSNRLVLKGNLGRDKERLLRQIEYAIHHPEILREKWKRGL